jgi:asparagine synthase (glutamine-hydrolysing)
MCGIAGILRFDGARADPAQARLMARLLAHRGPDGEGVQASGPAALAHRRLAIIDLSEKAAQPMFNEDRALWLVFNGEIYNYLELRPFLQSRHHRFASDADSEVILHQYEEEGPGCTARFNGMWAFALWDERRQEMILSRDRLGEKPLYYHADSSVLLFASEIKALLALRPDLSEPNPSELARFLATGWMETGTETFFRHIRQVPPGHTLKVSVSGQMDLSRYWELPRDEDDGPVSPRQAADTLRELLEDSIRLRLRSDVPIGTCLSGGLDSSSVVDLESRLLQGRTIHTFSSIFEENGFSERPFIEAVNAAYPTEAHRTTPSADFQEILPRILWHQECPLAGPGVYPQWCVMALARGKVKVLLDGQGSDELLGGYFYYYPEHLADLWARVGTPAGAVALLGASARILRRLPPTATARALWDGLRRLRGEPRHAGFQGGWHADYLVPDLAAELNESIEAPPAGRESFLGRALRDDLIRTSLPKLLHYEDRNSMAHGLEARVPFLDHRLVEFCMRLPGRLRIEAGTTKSPLRRAMRGRLPAMVSERIDKKGFPEPVGLWLKGSGHGWARELLLSERTRSRGIFRMERLERGLEEHRAGRSRTVPLYRALTLETWLRLFQDGEGAPRFAGRNHSAAEA